VSSWLVNGAWSFLCCDLSMRHPAHLLYYVPHQHTSGIISNHKMQHVNTGEFQHVRYVVRFFHLLCIPVTVSQYGQFKRFNMPIIKTKLCWWKKAYLPVCLYLFVFPHHGCQATAHTSLYVTLLGGETSPLCDTNIIKWSKNSSQNTTKGILAKMGSG